MHAFTGRMYAELDEEEQNDRRGTGHRRGDVHGVHLLLAEAGAVHVLVHLRLHCSGQDAGHRPAEQSSCQSVRDLRIENPQFR